jgi:hypothetical protein
VADTSLRLIFRLNHTSRQVVCQARNPQRDIFVQYSRCALYILFNCMRLTKKEGTNPYNGTVSFDNIAQAMELVFVIITSNTFTDLMLFPGRCKSLTAGIMLSTLSTWSHHYVSFPTFCADILVFIIGYSFHSLQLTIAGLLS